MTGNKFHYFNGQGSQVLLAKLEERSILGEITEEAYSKLVEKYSEEE